jgi:hypoxanthine phosphoribosyltransferase
MESLTDSGLGLRRARRHLLDLSDPKIKKRLLEEILRDKYCETEIEYLIKIIKNKNYSERQDEL